MGLAACALVFAALASVVPEPSSNEQVWSLGVRTETRTRSGTNGGTAETPRLDGEVDPTIALRIGFVAITYAPRLTQTLAGAAADAKVLHEGDVAAVFRSAGNWRVRGSQRLAYGTLDPSPLARQFSAFGTGGLLGTPGAPSLRYVNSDTGVAFDGRLAPAFTLSARLGWTVAGGVDARPVERCRS